MTRRELNLAIFEGTADGVLWQPRLETWIGHHMREGTMPARFRGMDALEIYDELGCSVRYAASAGLNRHEEREDLVRIHEQHPDHSVETVRTPAGEITTVHQEVWEEGERRNRRISSYPVKTAEQLAVATDLVERQSFTADVGEFERAAARVGHRAEPTLFTSSSGFTELIKRWCGLEQTFYLLHDEPAAVERYLEACDRRDDRMLEEALKLPCHIFNLGDHATNEFTPPPILEKYMLPRWQRLADRLDEAGRFVHSHWDGNSKLLLPYARRTHLHAIEALTPAPMGDITLDEIKDGVGDEMVVLDLLPAIDFLPGHSTEDLLDFTRRVIDMFAPRLILGISDEISAPGQIQKVETVTRLVDDICGPAE